MNHTKVADIARRHQQLAARGAFENPLDTEATRHEDATALNELWQRIQSECLEYCAAYNAGFGAVRITSEVHADTIVIRSQPDQQDTLVFRRTLPSPAHSVGMEAHRYHYQAQPVDLPVGLRRATVGGLVLTQADKDVTPDDLVLELLTEFTEQLARGNAGSAHAAEGPLLKHTGD